jgi:hypothetical protein
VDATWDRVVNLGGDTMTGDLTLPGDPTQPLHAATKQYVDNTVAAIPPPNAADVPVAPPVLGANDMQGALEAIVTELDTKVNRAGDTMTGMLVLFADPVAARDGRRDQADVDDTVAAIPPPNLQCALQNWIPSPGKRKCRAMSRTCGSKAARIISTLVLRRAWWRCSKRVEHSIPPCG